ncbi:MAG: PilZ domain-containing protein [Methylophilaceae bacterium]|nr:PilZ domain-containing protein [Methylophilaceae bacterium]
MSETGIIVEATLPFDWKPEPTPPSALTEMRRHGNIALLQALATLESSLQESEHDVVDPIQKRLDRIESKLDVLLLLVANLATESNLLPAEKSLRLQVDRISWEEDTRLPPPGQSLLLRLFPCPRLPQPLLLHAVVTETTPVVNTSRIVALFQDHDAELEEWLTRTLFRYHRRALQARKQS